MVLSFNNNNFEINYAHEYIHVNPYYKRVYVELLDGYDLNDLGEIIKNEYKNNFYIDDEYFEGYYSVDITKRKEINNQTISINFSQKFDGE